MHARAVCAERGRGECGCDGETYANRCERMQAGAALDHRGVCEDTDCRDSTACDTDEYCASPACGEVGSCEARPEVCTREQAPVCGCDGVTYGNACDAAANGVSVASQAECARTCGGFIGIACEAGEFCDWPAGQCSSADIQGTCVAQSEACPLIFDPVCGCDGATYSNDCFRVGAGVQKDHDGACASGACCDPATQPGADVSPSAAAAGSTGTPFCIEGSTCCANGQWACNEGDGSSTCPGDGGRICDERTE